MPELVWVTQGKTEHLATLLGTLGAESQEYVQIRWESTLDKAFVPVNTVRREEGRRRRRTAPISYAESPIGPPPSHENAPASRAAKGKRRKRGDNTSTQTHRGIGEENIDIGSLPPGKRSKDAGVIEGGKQCGIAIDPDKSITIAALDRSAEKKSDLAAVSSPGLSRHKLMETHAVSSATSVEKPEETPKEDVRVFSESCTNPEDAVINAIQDRSAVIQETTWSPPFVIPRKPLKIATDPSLQAQVTLMTPNSIPQNGDEKSQKRETEITLKDLFSTPNATKGVEDMLPLAHSRSHIPTSTGDTKSRPWEFGSQKSVAVSNADTGEERNAAPDPNFLEKEMVSDAKTWPQEFGTQNSVAVSNANTGEERILVSDPNFVGKQMVSDATLLPREVGTQDSLTVANANTGEERNAASDPNSLKKEMVSDAKSQPREVGTQNPVAVSNANTGEEQNTPSDPNFVGKEMVSDAKSQPQEPGTQDSAAVSNANTGEERNTASDPNFLEKETVSPFALKARDLEANGIDSVNTTLHLLPTANEKKIAQGSGCPATDSFTKDILQAITQPLNARVAGRPSGEDDVVNSLHTSLPTLNNAANQPNREITNFHLAGKMENCPFNVEETQDNIAENESKYRPPISDAKKLYGSSIAIHGERASTRGGDVVSFEELEQGPQNWTHSQPSLKPVREGVVPSTGNVSKIEVQNPEGDENPWCEPIYFPAPVIPLQTQARENPRNGRLSIAENVEPPPVVEVKERVSEGSNDTNNFLSSDEEALGVGTHRLQFDEVWLKQRNVSMAEISRDDLGALVAAGSKTIIDAPDEKAKSRDGPTRLKGKGNEASSSDEDVHSILRGKERLHSKKSLTPSPRGFEKELSKQQRLFLSEVSGEAAPGSTKPNRTNRKEKRIRINKQNWNKIEKLKLCRGSDDDSVPGLRVDYQ
jgi:hypothetical protein